jgi:hypothetical protein
MSSESSLDEIFIPSVIRNGPQNTPHDGDAPPSVTDGPPKSSRDRDPPPHADGVNVAEVSAVDPSPPRGSVSSCSKCVVPLASVGRSPRALRFINGAKRKRQEEEAAVSDEPTRKRSRAENHRPQHWQEHPGRKTKRACWEPQLGGQKKKQRTEGRQAPWVMRQLLAGSLGMNSSDSF